MDNFMTGFAIVAASIGAILILVAALLAYVWLCVELVWRMLAGNSKLAFLGLILLVGFALSVVGGIGYAYFNWRA